jgi:hypothetical protein
MTTDLSHLRPDFPILSREVNGKPLVYLDSAATTQKPEQVLAALDDYYRLHNANVHRGAYRLAEEATEMYEGARTKVAKFINAAAPEEVVFTRGTTSSLNAVAYGWGLYHLKAGDRIALTMMEHHANVVPWQLVARHTGAELVFLPLGPDYRIDVSDIDRIIDERVKIVAFSGMSNVLGTIDLVEAGLRRGGWVRSRWSMPPNWSPTPHRRAGDRSDFRLQRPLRCSAPPASGRCGAARPSRGDGARRGGSEMIRDGSSTTRPGPKFRTVRSRHSRSPRRSALRSRRLPHRRGMDRSATTNGS